MRYLIIAILVNTIFSEASASTYNPSSLPINAKTLSMMGLGVASDYNNWINPASMEYEFDELLEFSQNNWIFEDVSGASINYQSNGQSISYHYWKIDDINLYDDNPSEAPIGSISTENLFLQYSKSFSIQGHSIGFNLGARYMNFFDTEDKGLSLDFGYQKLIGSSFKVGVAIKNIYSDNSNSEGLPQLIVLGAKQKISKVPFILYFDLFHHENNGFGSFQAIKFDSDGFDLICGVKYLADFDNTDISLGVNFSWKRLEFSISTLLLENSSFNSPIFYQMSYLF